MNGSALRMRLLASTSSMSKAAASNTRIDEITANIAAPELDRPEVVKNTVASEDLDEPGQNEAPGGRNLDVISSAQHIDKNITSDRWIRGPITGPANEIQGHMGCVQEAQLSPDGTSVFTIDYSRSLSTFVIDQDIFDEDSTRSLRPHSRHRSPDPIRALAVNPYFNLSDSWTATILLSSRDQYITLHNVLWDFSQESPAISSAPTSGPIDSSKKLARYKLVDSLTEEVIAPLSLTYTLDGSHFLAGHKNRISVFDVNRQDSPVTQIKTIPTRKLKSGGFGYKGDVTAMSISSQTSRLAVGTRTRHVALYENEGLGEHIMHVELPKTLDPIVTSPERIGAGVTHLKWSPCGNYLYIAERMSDSILVYDVRNFSIGLRHCIGRNAMANQKLGIDVWSSGWDSNSHEVWAGGLDGSVRLWRDPHLGEGPLQPTEIVQVGDTPVTGMLVHPCGNLAITALGQLTAGPEQISEGSKERGDSCWQPRYSERGGLNILEFCSQ